MNPKRIPSGLALKEKSFTIPTLHIEIPVDFTIEDLLVPASWAHHAHKMHRGFEVIARRSDLAWRAHLQVIEVGIGFAKVHLLSKWENPDHKEVAAPTDDAPLPELPAGYKVKWVPGNKTFVVMVADIPEAVSKGHPSKLAAHNAAIAHAAKAMGQAA